MKLKEYFKQKKRIKVIKNQFRYLVRELQLFNSVGEYPNEMQLKFIEHGFEISFNISGICSFSKIENGTDFITNCFRAVQIQLSNSKGDITLKVYTEELEQLEYKPMVLPATELLLGYNYEGAITVNMRSSAHILLSGLSNNGKTGLLRVMIKNLQYNNNCDIILCNAFKDDFRGFKNLRYIQTEKDIKTFLDSILKEYRVRERPLYIILEELMTIRDKKLIDTIKQLLATSRHMNIYICGIVQVATKQNCDFKDLFNSRLSFKQVDSSSYTVALGVSVDKELKQREFYCLGDKGLVKGKTFNLDF